MINYTEQFCEAAEIIAKSVVEDMKFDKTIKAVIVKNNDLDNKGNLRKTLTGEYLCKYEGSEFLAYGSPCAYDIDDVVYINIPMGDWKNKKSIIGNNDGVNIVYINGTLKVFDNKGNYICDIGQAYENFENKKW